MDKGKRKPLKESSLNTTSIFIKPNVSKYRPKLNETVATIKGPVGNSLENASKAKLSNLKKPPLPPPASERVTKVSQLKMDIAYNEYLQNLLKQSIVQKQITDDKKVLEGQLRYYSFDLNKKQNILKKLCDKREFIEKQIEIIKMLKDLEEKLENAELLFSNYEVGSHMDVVKNILEKDCDKVLLKNIKLLNTQADYDNFIDTLKSLHTTLEKIMSSGINFSEIHDYAEEVRNFLQSHENVKVSQTELQKLETNGIRILLKKLSDMFGKQYENKPNNNLFD